MSAWALLTELDRLNVARKGEAAALRGFLRGRYRGLIEKLKAPWADKRRGAGKTPKGSVYACRRGETVLMTYGSKRSESVSNALSMRFCGGSSPLVRIAAGDQFCPFIKPLRFAGKTEVRDVRTDSHFPNDFDKRGRF